LLAALIDALKQLSQTVIVHLQFAIVRIKLCNLYVVLVLALMNQR
jgi:hypothetical protein